MYGAGMARLLIEPTPTRHSPCLCRLIEPVTVVLEDGTELYIPAGYVTNFASIPRFLWSLLSPCGLHNLAAVVHDYLYDNRLRSDELGEKRARRYADVQYRYFLSLAEPNRLIKRTLHYYAVCLFGRSHYRA